MLQTLQETGFTISQLERLCQAEQIEGTMRLLFALNHWAKARDRLFFADRQCLYQVKAVIIDRAYTSGLLAAKAYVDGRERFGEELCFDLAADIAAEGFLWRLEELAVEPERGREDPYGKVVRQLYTRMTGKEKIVADDVEALENAQVHEYILRCLQELEREARASGQPIPYSKLTALCIAPSDLLIIQDRRYYDLGDWYSWDQLDNCDLRKLDPEGLSLVAFDYTSPTAHYVFHLPFRIAEAFVSREQIETLKRTPWSSRESGEYYGRAVTEAESLQQPIGEILRALGADIVALCPHHLNDKQDTLFTQTMRCAVWPEEEFDEYYEDPEDEDFDETKARQMALYWHHLTRSNSAPTWRSSDSCPYCSLPIDIAPGLARVEHWQREHPDQDLTIRQASWMLDCRLEKKAFCLRYPPDYRAPHDRGFGTRYWKLETVKGWLSEPEDAVSGSPS